MSYSEYDDAAKATDKAAKKVSRRSIKRSYVIGLLAMLVAVVGFFLATSPGTAKDRYVLRTKTAIPALSKIDVDNLEIVVVPRGSVEGGLPDQADLDSDAALPVAERSAFAGRAFSAESRADLEKLRDEYFATGTDTFAQVDVPSGVQLRGDMLTYQTKFPSLAPGERLVSVSADISASVAGTLRAGDVVDVWTVVDNKLVTRVTAGVEIVAVRPSESVINSNARSSSETTVPASSTVIPGIYTLKANETQVASITLAAAQGNVYLVYRSATAVTGPAQSLTLGQALCTESGQIVVCDTLANVNPQGLATGSGVITAPVS